MTEDDTADEFEWLRVQSVEAELEHKIAVAEAELFEIEERGATIGVATRRAWTEHEHVADTCKRWKLAHRRYMDAARVQLASGE